MDYQTCILLFWQYYEACLGNINAKELGRLAQGYEDTKGTNTVRFMDREQIKQIPKDQTVTYARIVVDY